MCISTGPSNFIYSSAVYRALDSQTYMAAEQVLVCDSVGTLTPFTDLGQNVHSAFYEVSSYSSV